MKILNRVNKSKIKLALLTGIQLLTLLFTGCLGEVSSSAECSDELVLWYQQPASDWMTEALPVGNGKIGAMVFGGVQQQRLSLNEKSLWDGGPGEFPGYDGGNEAGGTENLENIRNLIAKGDYEKALSEGNKHLTGRGDGYGAYQVLGDLVIDYQYQTKKAQEYCRKLDLSTGVHSVSYRMGDTQYKRELFVSYPDNLMIMKITATGSDPLNIEIGLEAPKSDRCYRDSFGTALGTGLAPYKRGRTISKTTNGSRLTLDGMINSNGMEYQAVLDLMASDAVITTVGTDENPRLAVSGTDEVILVFTAATDYLPVYPDYKGNDYQSLNQKALLAAQGKGWLDLLEVHLQDYQELFNRVQFDLDNGRSSLTSLPTDQRLDRFSASLDPGLIELVYQYGRYLLISSSRKGALPANLQGMWNNSTAPPWSCDYHININLQMCYWPAELTNLPECHEPLLDYISTLVEPGRKTSELYYGTRGWVVHTMNNPFGFTAPGWGVEWGHFPGGAGWLCQHLYQHYEFSGDKEFLRDQAWPVMSDAALFWLDYLQEGENGKLVSSPSFSPEHGKLCAGTTMDHQIARELFQNCIDSAAILDIENELITELKIALEKIQPDKIGKWGQLQEWMEDWDDPNDQHRHISHLYALHPGSAINPIETPELAKAAETSLNGRGDSGTGWSIAWKINFWARLLDGDHSYRLMKNLLNLTAKKGVTMNFGGGLYSNLLDAHPPFQIDGNMGYVSGVSEMLLQSHADLVHILPALPSSWKKGSIEGLSARGGFICDIEWEEGLLVEAKIVSTLGGELILKYNDQILSMDTVAGETVTFFLTETDVLNFLR